MSGQNTAKIPAGIRKFACTKSLLNPSKSTTASTYKLSHSSISTVDLYPKQVVAFKFFSVNRIKMAESKVALVTGSSSGIGAATAKLFSQRGYKVVVTGSKAEKVERVANECAEVSPGKFQVCI